LGFVGGGGEATVASVWRVKNSDKYGGVHDSDGALIAEVCMSPGLGVKFAGKEQMREDGAVVSKMSSSREGGKGPHFLSGGADSGKQERKGEIQKSPWVHSPKRSRTLMRYCPMTFFPYSFPSTTLPAQ